MSEHHQHSETQRLEAFSDGMFAIIITIMVLELKVPESMSMEGLKPLIPVFLSYVLSFFYLAIYWNNHHHLLHATKGITSGIMWANMHLLFWLSLIPFASGWMGESHGELAPAIIYAAVLLCAALAYFILTRRILANEGRNSRVGQAIGRDIKGKISIVCYIVAIACAFSEPKITYAIVALVALMWVVPDRRLAPLFDHTQD